MAGVWTHSGAQFHDINGKPYPGAKVYFYAADSLTPITVYQDYGLGTAHPNPVEADGNGFFPPVFLDEADNFFRQRITTRAGVTIGRTDLTVLPIIGPAGGGGGSEVPVDPNALFQTGDLIWLDRSGTKAGWVRDNGRTIGSATSGASERANADCEQLYLFGWAAGWTVSGGSGANAAADWAANKPITLPDKRFRLAAGLADMGNTAVSSTGVPFTSGNSTTAGSLGGESTAVISNSQLPVTNLVFTGTQQTWTTNQTGVPSLTAVGSTVADAGQNVIRYGGLISPLTTTITPAGTISSFGGGAAISKMPPFVLGTYYRKL